MGTSQETDTVLLDLEALREVPLVLLDPREDQTRASAAGANVEPLAADLRQGRGKLLQPIRVWAFDMLSDDEPAN